jgi:hypothetical protein
MVVEAGEGTMTLARPNQSKILHHEGVKNVKHRLDDSPVWTDLLKVRHLYPGGGEGRNPLPQNLYMTT